jgi:hypothetical protein
VLGAFFLESAVSAGAADGPLDQVGGVCVPDGATIRAGLYEARGFGIGFSAKNRLDPRTFSDGVAVNYAEERDSYICANHVRGHGKWTQKSHRSGVRAGTGGMLKFSEPIPQSTWNSSAWECAISTRTSPTGRAASNRPRNVMSWKAAFSAEVASAVKLGRKRTLSDQQRAEAIRRRAAGETLAAASHLTCVGSARMRRCPAAAGGCRGGSVFAKR